MAGSSWYPEGSMKGSGIDSVDITREVECECGHAWEMDFSTDDWGNVEEDVKCPSCENKFTFTYEKGDTFWDDVDAAYEAWAEK